MLLFLFQLCENMEESSVFLVLKYYDLRYYNSQLLFYKKLCMVLFLHKNVNIWNMVLLHALFYLIVSLNDYNPQLK